MAETVVAPDLVRALANPMRLQLLAWLREPGRYFPADVTTNEAGICVSHLQAKAGLAQSTVSAYLSELERAGLVRSTRVGKWTHYRRDEDSIADLVALLGRTV